MRLHEGVTHLCGCGVEFSLTPRAEYTRVKDGREPICRDCRFPLIVVVSESMVEWWREPRFEDGVMLHGGFSPETALELAEVAFGPRELWVEGIRQAIVPGGFTGGADVERMSA